MTAESTTPTTLDPHGYFPVVVDESVLTPSERRESLLEMFRSHAAHDPVWQWVQGLSAEEKKRIYDNAKPGLGAPTVDHLDRAGQSLAAQHRDYARKQFSDGERVWYGDGVPPWRRRKREAPMPAAFQNWHC